MNEDVVEQILADFRGWLGDRSESSGELETPDPPLDLATFVSHFTALRQEVNLQTRASRSQLEQNAQALQQLARAVEALERPRGHEAPADETLRPLLKTLIDVQDALSLSYREARRVQSAALAQVSAPDAVLPFWARALGIGKTVQHAIHEARAAEAESRQRVGRMVDALVVGYDMSLSRLERTLAQAGVERIECVGEPFDPETMEVAEVVRDPDRTSTEVIEEVRPGYRLSGRLLRFAQVRVARP